MEPMHSIAEIMPGLIDRLPLEPITVLRSLWASIAGKPLAEHTEPRALESGILRIAVSDPGWKQGMEAIEAEIVAKINRLAGKPLVRELRLELKRSAEGAASESDP